MSTHIPYVNRDASSDIDIFYLIKLIVFITALDIMTILFRYHHFPIRIPKILTRSATTNKRTGMMVYDPPAYRWVCTDDRWKKNQMTSIEEMYVDEAVAIITKVDSLNRRNVLTGMKMIPKMAWWSVGCSANRTISIGRDIGITSTSFTCPSLWY